MTEQEVFIHHPRVCACARAHGSRECALENGCNAEALKSISAPPVGILSENELSICASAAAGCERHQFAPTLKSLSLLYLPWVSFKSVFLSSAQQGGSVNVNRWIQF